MIRTLMGVEWTALKRDRVALFLTFVLPLVFFSIFALIFSGTSSQQAQDLDLGVLIVDQDGSTLSRRLAESLASQAGLAASFAPEPSEDRAEPQPWTRESAHLAVRKGRADAAVVLPAGLSERFAGFGGELPEVEVLYDAANPRVQFAVSGLVRAASFETSPDLLMEKGLGMLELYGGPLTSEQQRAVDFISSDMGAAMATLAGEDGPTGLVDVVTTAAHDEDEGKSPSIVAYYAAGIAVMFLLFSMTGAAGGLLEEEDNGTLERLLTSRVTMGTLLASRWIFFGVLGFLQVTLMFVWGWAIFGLDLWAPQRLVGFLAMTVATAAAAAAFGLVLAALCRSRAQLSGVSTVVILIMSALGGSMVPRFVMPSFMETVAKFTFNGWALDGYLEVFWYADPEASLPGSLAALAPQLAVLTSLAVLFFLVARRLARRWEIV